MHVKNLFRNVSEADFWDTFKEYHNSVPVNIREPDSIPGTSNWMLATIVSAAVIYTLHWIMS